ncbi:MAG: KH domain-containing protein [Synechococcales bacterium]|nr:KH domain-containing protein [Synechococcales bacterium]
MSDSVPYSPKAPDFAGLVQFLLAPFLDRPEALKVDCEFAATRPRVWVRVAFDGGDRGRAFGRGGRNIHALRQVLEGVANAAGYTASLEVFGGAPTEEVSQGQARQDFQRGRSSSSRSVGKPQRRS